MQVVIHQAEGQNDDAEFPRNGVYSVHTGYKVVPVPEQYILGGAVGREMPAVANGKVLSFNKREADGQVGENAFHIQVFWLCNKNGDKETFFQGIIRESSLIQIIEGGHLPQDSTQRGNRPLMGALSGDGGSVERRGGPVGHTESPDGFDQG